ncbi:hypothetical protein INR49_012696 [Caranx melampygus]|nr:hypothetical protein INR49_012696 [Caranx melampygus]
MGNCPIRCQSNMPILANSPEPASPATQESMTVSLYNYPSFGHTEVTMQIGERLTILSEWLFTGISRYKAMELLMQPNNQNGSFLIRESETVRDCYSLSVLRKFNSSYNDCVKHYRISHLQNGWVYISPGLTFPSLHHLVEHYTESPDGLVCRLTAPCYIKGLDNTREARPIPVAIRRPTINWKDISRSVIFRRKRTESDNSLVSEGLREAISSYLQMTEGNEHSWDA